MYDDLTKGFLNMVKCAGTAYTLTDKNDIGVV